MFGLVGRFMEYIIGVILLFIMPILLIMIKTDQVIQSHVQETVEEFVTKCSATGQVDQAGYMEFISKLDSTGVTYNVTFSHEHLVYEPYVNIAGNTVSSNYESGFATSYYATGTNEILDVIYNTSSDMTYYMSDGDYFYCTVVNKTPTLASRMLSAMHFTGDVEKIIGKYSALVTRVNENAN